MKKAIARVQNGERLVLMATPETIRDHSDLLEKAGFGGDKSYYFADEAHKLAIGQQDGAGSMMANAAAKMAKSEYAAVGSGSLIDNNTSELHYLYNLMHPDELGGKKEFVSEWQRLAQGGDNSLFKNEALRGIRSRLEGGMVSHHGKFYKKDGSEVQMEHNVVKVEPSKAQIAAIKDADALYAKERVHDNPDIRKAAALRRMSRHRKIFNEGVVNKETGQLENPKAEAIKKILDAEKARDPKNRIGVFAYEKKFLRNAHKTAGGKMLYITGDEQGKDVANAVNSINDRTNGTDGGLLSPAANYGLNMQGIDHMVLLHPLNNYSEVDQVNGRTLRTGQSRDIRGSLILMNHPTELMAYERTHRKRKKDTDMLKSMAYNDDLAAQLAPHEKTIQAAAKA
jgi:hypothetical protein